MKFIDITGQRFGKLTVLELYGKKGHDFLWVCKCDCGNLKNIRGSDLKNGKSKTCGKHKIINFENKQIGMLKILKMLPERKEKGRVVWQCECKCGEIVKVSSAGLLKNKINACKKCTALSRKSLDRTPILKHRIYKHYHFRSKKKNIPFDISFEKFTYLSDQPCHYCGLKNSNLSTERTYKGKKVTDAVVFYNGLDRIDNNKGYTEDNIYTCCQICNYAKNNMSLEQFELWLTQTYNYHILGNKEITSQYQELMQAKK
jgi:5-methylcytosine-specific restriction endonuclease McrA